MAIQAVQAVIVDSREPDWVKGLRFGGAPVMCAELEQGDVHVVCDDGALLVIERKAPEDLLQSIKDARLFAQLSRLKKVSPWAYVLITGQIERGRDGNVIVESRVTGWNWNAVMGALLTMQECGVFAHWCAGDMDFENAVIRLANRDRKGVMLVPPVRAARVAPPAVMMLAALPNIGVEKAEMLLEQSGRRPAIALRNLLDMDAVTPGVGSITKTLARTALGLDNNMELVVRWADDVLEETNVETSELVRAA